VEVEEEEEDPTHGQRHVQRLHMSQVHQRARRKFAEIFGQRGGIQGREMVAQAD
jgi:hypothetical protein